MCGGIEQRSYWVDSISRGINPSFRAERRWRGVGALSERIVVEPLRASRE